MIKVERVHIKGKESFLVSIFIIFVFAILLLPVLSVLFLKFLFSSIQKLRNFVLSITQVNLPLLEKVY